MLNIGRGSLDRNVAGRQADSSRAAPVAGLLICCERRRCGGDRDRGSTRRQQWCDVLAVSFPWWFSLKCWIVCSCAVQN